MSSVVGRGARAVDAGQGIEIPTTLPTTAYYDSSVSAGRYLLRFGSGWSDGAENLLVNDVFDHSRRPAPRKVTKRLLGVARSGDNHVRSFTSGNRPTTTGIAEYWLANALPVAPLSREKVGELVKSPK